jgi:hypothetical protein
MALQVYPSSLEFLSVNPSEIFKQVTRGEARNFVTKATGRVGRSRRMEDGDRADLAAHEGLILVGIG